MLQAVGLAVICISWALWGTTGCAPRAVSPDVTVARESPVFCVSLGSVEEGARMMTPGRLLPFDHPDAHDHEFPNPAQLWRGEVDALVAMGRHAGLDLRATLLRYPRPPADDWPYTEFRAPPAEAIVACDTVRRFPRSAAPLPGLRVVAVIDGAPVAYILDTRGMTLEERGMSRPTTMGLDIDRATMLRALDAVRQMAADVDDAIVVYDPPA
ncbi:MAG: hypothetical protein D6701_14890 [Gemmatimonadetes bacterium]|nr:MAG: hypothetical protein D6701_14890 [Gemmatimonadota bacterium]